ncbi:Chorismate pyruvate-lyase [Halomonadaceae bacterium LMG 33818]|uniref:chorismate--pyruvate lyase family protein n=1 Tax=Cernens ardua TaxID=3402176 RepID=UPI003EDBAC1D
MNTPSAIRYPDPSSRWHQATFSLTHEQRHWLTLQGSLTVALKALGEFSLRVLFEGKERVWQDEAKALELHPGEEAWVREVVMALDGIPCVAARSLTPLSASKGDWRGLRHCGNTPLGSQLYHRANIRRTPFQWCTWPIGVTHQNRTSWEARLLRMSEGPEQYHNDTASGRCTSGTKKPCCHTPLFARRSIFYKSHHGQWRKPTRLASYRWTSNGSPMLVMECFLPTFWLFAQGYQPLNLNPRWSPCRRARAYTRKNP